MFRKLGAVTLLGGLATLALTQASWGGATMPATAPSAGGGQTSVVRRGTLVLSLDFDGTFEPSAPFEARIRTRSYQGDFIVARAVTTGATVAKGDVLLELESDRIDDQIAAAQNDLKLADANLAKAQGDVDLGQESDVLAMANAKISLANGQTDLKRWDEKDGPAFLVAAGLNAKIGDFEVESASDELDQLRKMYKSEDLTSETADIVMKRAVRILDLEKLMSQVAHAIQNRMAEFEAGIRRQSLSMVVDQQTLSIAQLDASQAQGRVTRETSLFSARAAVDQARRKLTELKNDRKNFSVISPIDGVVVYGSFEHGAWHEIEPSQLASGEKVKADQVLLTVYQPGNLRLRAGCPEGQIALVSAGSKVTVRPDALPGQSYQGGCEPMRLIGQAGKAQQHFDVIVDLPSVDERLAPGFKAEVKFDAGKLQNVLLVPATAVWRGKVWISKPGAAAGSEEPRNVVVGYSNGQDIQIKSGLEEGETVLTQAKHPGASSS
ncbi:MAG: HlyD family efflux transporter periplasmic adaptor subunit [Tepidisphaeraceae bacterium]|jgi:multidrug efflux pump subunit AcrA (membrane-fusion protein)